MKKLLVLLAAAFGALALAAGPSAAATFVVDNDGADCPDADFTTVQAAVTAAGAGDRVEVCAGTYPEQVVIGPGKDGLRLAARHRRDDVVILAPPTIALSVTKAIVQVTGSLDVEIKHLTISGPGPGPCDSIRWGIRLDGGASAKIEHNHITLIRDTPLSGCQNGIGILVGRNAEFQVATAKIKHNLIDKYQKGGIVVDNAGSFADIEHNDIVGPDAEGGFTPLAPNGVQVSRGAGAKVKHNDVTGNAFGGDPALGTGSGILLFRPGAGAVDVEHNEVYRNDDGIPSIDTHGAEIKHNRVYESFIFDGIFLDSDSSGNRIEHNRMHDNFEHDCHDDSGGDGTAGTANFWKGNRGETQNRPGLCKS